MNECNFIDRLIKLRYYKEVTSRRMSLSLGHEPEYIYNIEYGNYLPTLREFFEICDYLKVTPMEFFDYEDDFSKDCANYKEEHDVSKIEDSDLNSILTELQTILLEINKEIKKGFALNQ